MFVSMYEEIAASTIFQMFDECSISHLRRKFAKYCLWNSTFSFPTNIFRRPLVGHQLSDKCHQMSSLESHSINPDVYMGKTVSYDNICKSLKSTDFNWTDRLHGLSSLHDFPMGLTNSTMSLRFCSDCKIE